jgi:hypothetical protein
MIYGKDVAARGDVSDDARRVSEKRRKADDSRSDPEVVRSGRPPARRRPAPRARVPGRRNPVLGEALEPAPQGEARPIELAPSDLGVNPNDAPLDDPLPAWAWVLLESYVDRCLEVRGVPAPTARETLEELARLWPDLSVTILVQMPWMGTIRFKRLLRLQGDAMRPFLEAPEAFIRERFGGGKFKMNFHHGLHFVNTKNFKPTGPPRWEGVPEITED